jgi:hypothetical protein
MMPMTVLAMATEGEGNARGRIVVRIAVDHGTPATIVVAIEVTMVVMAVVIVPIVVVTIVVMIAGLSSRSREGGNNGYASDKDQFLDIHHKDSE